ncbi:MAG: hypothetical protein ABJN69_11290 [Hellea sp.]
MKLSLDNRVFIPVENSDNGVVNGKTRFHFWQEGMVFYADYFGGDVREGHIIGQFTDETEDETWAGNMLYHCLTTDKALKAGKARAVFSVVDDGRIAFNLDWEWITGDHSWGHSRYEELIEKGLIK